MLLGLQAQDVPYSIRLDVPLVSVDFTITDASGKAVTDLNQYDFEVRDNGQSRPIVNFSPVSTPYNMLALLDCSGSTQDRVSMLLSVTARFADQLRKQDKAAVAVFGSDIELAVDWDGKQKHVNTVTSPACNGTSFNNAVLWAVKKFKDVKGRRGVVVLSDGKDSDVPRSNVRVDGITIRRIVPPEQDNEFQKVLKTVRDSKIPFYFVAVDTDLNPGKDYAGPLPDLQQPRARLEQLAAQSGGRIVYPKTPGEVVPMILQFGRDLGISYSVGFAPANPKDHSSHEIEIRVRGVDGYVVKQSKTAYAVQ